MRAGAFVALLARALSLAAALCTASPASAQAPAVTATARADAGADRQASRAPYRRAISLAPHITELIFAAGAGQYIAGTVTRSDYPPAARAIPRVGDGVAVSPEAVLALHPDVALAWRASGAARRLAPLLRRAGVPLILSAPASLDDIPAQVLRMGTLFGTSASAAPAAQALAARIQALRTQYAQRSPVSVFIEISEPPLYVVANDPVIDDALKACGGVNVFADIDTPAAQASRESVLLRQPDLIIAPYQDADSIRRLRQRWAGLGLQAAVKGRVYGINPDQLFRPGARMVDATEKLCTLLDLAR